jgi:outer membrane protein
MQSSMFRPGLARVSAGAAIVLVFLTHASRVLAQNVPQSSNHPWHGPQERSIEADAKNFPESRFKVDPDKNYSLPELIDLAESHNPETRCGSRCRTQRALSHFSGGRTLRGRSPPGLPG